jgi:putative DNA primase/helicase
MAAPPDIPIQKMACDASPWQEKVNRETFTDKIARVLPLLEDEEEAWLTYCLRKPDEIKRDKFKWSGEGGLLYSRTGRRAGRWWCFGNNVGGDLLDFYAHYSLRNPKALSEALKGAMEWLGLPFDGPVPDASRASQRRREQEQKRAAREAEQAADDAKQSAKVAAIVAACLPVQGSLGEKYIRYTRAITEASFVNAPVVWDPAEHALAFLVTDDDRAIRALQHVALTKAGAKDDNRYYRGKDKRGAKNSVGPVSQGVVRFPAMSLDLGEYLLVAEGPETAWTANAALRFEAWACLGGMSRVADFDIGRRVVIFLRDDDGVTTGGYRASKETVRKLREAGHEVIEAFPFEQARGNGDDFNTLAQESSLDAVRDRIQHAIDKHASAIHRLEFPLDQANERLSNHAREFFEECVAAFDHDDENAVQPVVALGATVGAGKSYAFLSAAVDRVAENCRNDVPRVGVFLTPEHRLSDEQAKKFNEIAEERGVRLRAGVHRGREALNPDGADADEKMCLHIEDIRQANLHAVDDIEAEVCAVCPDRMSCAYMAQRLSDYDFIVSSHNMQFADLPPMARQRGLDFTVIDEPMHQAGMIGVDGWGIQIPLDSLMPAAGMARCSGPEGDRLVAIREDLARTLMDEPDGFVSVDAIRRANFDDGTAEFARGQEDERKQDKRHQRDWRKRTANADLHRMAMLWTIIDKGMKDGSDTLGHLRLITNKEGVRVLHLYGRQDVKGEFARVPTIHINALHRPDLIAHYYPTVEDLGFIHIAAPYQRIRQVTGNNWAKSFLLPEDGDMPEVVAKRLDKLRRAKATVLREAASIGGSILFVACKDVVLALRKQGLPSNIKTGWFNAVAGRNEFEGVDGRDFDGVIILGTINPTVDTMERAAAALTGKPPKTLSGGETQYPLADAYRLVRRGKSIVSIPTQDRRHPDDLVEALRAHITLGEIIQAMGRGRGVRRGADKPVQIVILSDAVMPFPVDEIVSQAAKDISHRDLMLAEGGIAFEDGTSAAKAYPGLYRSPVNARDLFREERNRADRTTAWGSLREISIREPHALLPEAGSAVERKDVWGRSLSLALFQKAGERQRPQRAWFDAALCPDPRGFIEAAVGPLARFEVTGPSGDPISLPVAVGSDLTDPPNHPPAPRQPARCDRDGCSESGMVMVGADIVSQDIVSTASLVPGEDDTVLHESNKPQTFLNVGLLSEATIKISQCHFRNRQISPKIVA